MLRELRKNGATITSTQTLQNWLHDEVIGPEDRKSITAVGHTISSNRLLALARDLDKSFERIRALRRGLGRRLSTIVRQTFKAAATDSGIANLEGLDPRLELPLAELLESVDLAEVTLVAASQAVPAHWSRRWRRVS